MEQVLEYIDAWMKSQKDFMESWVKSQKEFTANWMMATQIIQGALINMTRPPEGSKDILDFYKSALIAMVESSKSLTAEAEKVQETWKKTAERQMEISREFAKNYSELFNKKVA